eukprot:scaffold26685_cov13-Tisochrysis_lutea.AAC.1
MPAGCSNGRGGGRRELDTAVCAITLPKAARGALNLEEAGADGGGVSPESCLKAWACVSLSVKQAQ